MSRWWQVTLVGTYRLTLELKASTTADALDRAFELAEVHVLEAGNALELANSLVQLEDAEDFDECSGPHSAPSDVDGDDYA